MLVFVGYCFCFVFFSSGLQRSASFHEASSASQTHQLQRAFHWFQSASQDLHGRCLFKPEEFEAQHVKEYQQSRPACSTFARAAGDVITVTHGLNLSRPGVTNMVTNGGIFKMIFKMCFYVFISLIFQSSVTPAVICLLLLALSELFKSPFPDTPDKIQSSCTTSCRCGRSAASPCRCPPVSRTLIKAAH